MATFTVDTTGKEVLAALDRHMSGKTILITGPSKDGIGAEIAKTLAEVNPKCLLLLGRNASKITPVIEQIKTGNPTVDAKFIQCDLSDNASVRYAAEKVNSVVDAIDVVINNAGIMAARTFQKSRDGLELQLASGYLGHFLLTNLIMDKVVTAKGVIVNITSSAYTLDEVDISDPNFSEGKTYNPWTAYARTKTANILFTFAVAKKLGHKGVASFAVDPGMVKGTNLMANTGVDGELMQQGMEMAIARNGGQELPPHPLVSLQQGCAGAILVSLDYSFRAKSPAFVKECCVTKTLEYASDADTAQNLWVLSEKLVGQSFTY